MCEVDVVAPAHLPESLYEDWPSPPAPSPPPWPCPAPVSPVSSGSPAPFSHSPLAPAAAPQSDNRHTLT